MKTAILPLKHSVNYTHCQFALLILLPLACVALAPQARATCQQGCDTGNFNTFLGDDALVDNTTGFGNTAIGSRALVNNTTGNVNTATGYNALYNNTTGYLNTATGAGALNSNTTGYSNTATGASALSSNTTGYSNTATGYAALYNTTTGNSNTAIGDAALTFNTTGYLNTATGALALDQNTTGYSNTAIGSSALLLNTTGTGNTATGASALEHNTTGSDNIAVGASAGSNLTTGSDNIYIGNSGVAGESNRIRIGTQETHTATYIAGISQTSLAHGTAVAVGITADGQLGVRASSVRFKEAIKPMDKASEAIFSLQPVTFRYKKDPLALAQFGLVAEEVAEVNPDLVARDKEGKPFTVRYEEINAMLLNEFLKEHRKVEQLEKQVEALSAGLQKVSAQLELNKSARQTVVTNQ
jgi:hypothetical protein